MLDSDGAAHLQARTAGYVCSDLFSQRPEPLRGEGGRRGWMREKVMYREKGGSATLGGAPEGEKRMNRDGLRLGERVQTSRLNNQLSPGR